MKHAILGPAKRINRVLDAPTAQTLEITDEQAAIVAAAEDRVGYFLIDGEFLSGAQNAARLQAERKAAREAERLAAMPPEQLAAHTARLQRQAAYDAAAAVFESLPLGKQALWEPVRAAVAKAIMAGEMATAYEIVSTLPVIYPGAEDDRALFLALFTA